MYYCTHSNVEDTLGYKNIVQLSVDDPMSFGDFTSFKKRKKQTFKQNW